MKKDFGTIFWLHLGIILLVYSSPFWLSWKIILAFILAYYLQLMFLKNCILTTLQFNEKTTFNAYYLAKLGFNPDTRKLNFFLDYFIPWLIFLVAIVWQLVFKAQPLIYI